MEEKTMIEMTEEEREAYEAWLSGKTQPPKEGFVKKAKKFVGKHKKAIVIAGGAILAKVAYDKGHQAGVDAARLEAYDTEVDETEEDEETDENE